MMTQDNSRTEFLARQLARSISGPMWHGPALAELLARFSPSEALSRPDAMIHSAWELVAHMTAWAEIAAERLEGRALEYPGAAGDWPPAPNRLDAEQWNQAIARLTAAYDSLAEAVTQLPPARLDEALPGGSYDVATMLHGVVEHAAYHGGQVAILRRALGIAG